MTVIVQSRLSQMDDSLEEAALDLGAKPAKVFFLITLPIIFPALLSGWLLAFTLSLDDLVIASFVAGPGSSTLPMVVFSKVRLGVKLLDVTEIALALGYSDPPNFTRAFRRLAGHSSTEFRARGHTAV